MAATGESVDLSLVDTLHPVEAPPHTPSLRLVATASTSPHELACPIHPRALIQHLIALGKPSPLLPLAHGWQCNPYARTLERAGQPSVNLTEKEAQLLVSLLTAPAETSIEREALLEAVWGMDSGVETHTLETHIYRLRTKLESLVPLPGNIVTEAGRYYLDTK